MRESDRERAEDAFFADVNDVAVAILAMRLVRSFTPECPGKGEDVKVDAAEPTRVRMPRPQPHEVSPDSREYWPNREVVGRIMPAGTPIYAQDP